MENLSLIQWGLIAGAAILLLSGSGTVKSILSAVWSKATTPKVATTAGASDESNVAAFKTIRHKLLAVSPDLAKQVWDAIQPTDEK